MKDRKREEKKDTQDEKAAKNPATHTNKMTK